MTHFNGNLIDVMVLFLGERSIQQTLEVTDATSYKPRIPDFEEQLSDELVIALVGPIASGCSATANQIAELLKSEFDNTAFRHKLSDMIQENADAVDGGLSDTEFVFKRVSSFQKVGDKLRKRFGNGCLASKIVAEIAKNRDENDGFQQSGDEEQRVLLA